MKEKLEIFKNEKIVVNVRSQKQYDDFMKLCEEQGLKWSTGDLPTKQYYRYNKYEEETCINLNNLSSLSYYYINYYKDNYYKIITYEDFMTKSNQFTKSDLKDNHIVKVKLGDYVVMKQFCQKEELDDNLVPNGWEDWRIDEVWEFDKLVWKREEQILDEVEIIKEDKQIEKFEINYARDIEEKIFYEESDKLNHCIMSGAGTELLINKINEIIDKLNELEKEKE